MSMSTEQQALYDLAMHAAYELEHHNLNMKDATAQKLIAAAVAAAAADGGKTLKAATEASSP